VRSDHRVVRRLVDLVGQLHKQGVQFKSVVSSFLADLILLSVIWRLRPPLRPSWRATSRPARVRSIVSSRSISARLAMTWKKKRPEGVPVSMESVTNGVPPRDVAGNLGVSVPTLYRSGSRLNIDHQAFKRIDK
jgi:hypothetical protein